MATVVAPGASTESSRQGSIPWQLTSALFLLPAAALYTLFVLWPLVQVGRLSLFQWSGYGPKSFVGLSNFTTLLGDPLFRLSLGHTVLWEVGAILIPTSLALAVALLLARSLAPRLFLAALFFPALLPPTVVAATWVLLYSPTSGLLGTLGPDWLGDPHLALASLFLAWLWSIVGVGVLIFWAALQGISRAQVELALVEGVGPIRRFRHVTFPAISRAWVLVLAINAALAAQVFDLVFVTTGGGPGYATMILPLEIYGRTFGGQTGQGAAAASMQVALGILLAGIVALTLRPQEETGEAEAPSRRAGSALPTIFLAPVVAVVLLPMAWLIPIALQPGRSFAIGGPTFNLGSWQLGNIATVWDAGMAGALATSLLLALAVVMVTVLVATPAAFALAHRRTGILSRAIAAFVLLVGLFQPTPALLVPLFALLHDLGFLGSVWGILLPEIARALPFAVLVLWGFLAQTQRSLLEAAEVDGAGPLRQMLSIALPGVRPALLAVAIWSFITSWNEYLLPIVVAQDGSISTVPTLLGSFIGKYNTQLGLLAAGALMAMLPSLLIYLLLRGGAAEGLSRAEPSRL